MNRNKLIELFISNIANAIVHKILEKAIDVPEIIGKYRTEVINSWKIALGYRNKINPIDFPLPEHDTEEIKNRVINNVKAELKLRIGRGYKNISIDSVGEIVEQTLKEMNVI
ncbi:hypothetical protein COV15_03340 [Candidatus Woesearchaeota archaeon CG10_big_fil_rev_8_21_14_0_10_34_12]|nr:MAG: hypothetical protein COV15_03340 [Candidatus Woesearchaeota archaeon CG10_big_fil_rev_8_21_14_0_10_34_12]